MKFLPQYRWIQFFILVISILFQSSISKSWDKAFKIDKAGFSIKFRGLVLPYRVMGIFILPNEQIHLQAINSNIQDSYILDAKQGKVILNGKNKWIWQAPTNPGLHPIKIFQLQPQDSIRMNVFVMAPFSNIKDGRLNGCDIGEYPTIPLKYANKKYKAPVGFIEVTKDNENTWISPHFKLNQFLCKQNGDYPKYIVLKERLLLKLELILELLNEKGIHCNTLKIMSGYRTPHYNKTIGNVKFSRHIFGGAADFYVDVSPEDGMMDDLNGDGKINIKDAKMIYYHIESISDEPFYQSFIGGLAAYKKTASHGPFVHIDVRGYKARW